MDLPMSCSNDYMLPKEANAFVTGGRGQQLSHMALHVFPVGLCSLHKQGASALMLASPA
jgi:hypothetical protein